VGVATVGSQRRWGWVVAIAMALLCTAIASIQAGEQAQATSGGDPYSVPVVTDTNADPNIVETTIVADETSVDIGNGVTANAMTFNGTIPGPEFRLTVGQTVIVHFKNQLATEATGIHWHGIELNNASDGTPLTQNQTAPGGSFLYQFKVPRPGVYWYHPHHHSSTNQVFKGLYGSIIVTDPNEAALVTSGMLPNATRTRTVVLSDITVCKAPGTNDTATYDPALPWVGGGPLPAQPPPTPAKLCDTPIDDHGNLLGAPLNAGDVPNIQLGGSSGRTNEGQTVLTNGKNVGGRGGNPSAPGALAAGASSLAVQPGQGLRLQLVNTATIRYMRLRLTTSAGVLVPLVRVGGEGGLLDAGIVEGGVVGGFDFKYGSGEILLGPGDRADVVAAIPANATGVATMWAQDFARTGLGFTNTPTVPVMHLNVTGAAGAYTIAEGTALRTATGSPVETLGPATSTLLNPAIFVPAKPGTASQDIQLTANGGSLGVNFVQGTHDFPGDYSTAPAPASARYARLGDTLELTITNTTDSHHPFHLHGFSIQPLSYTRASFPTYTFPYREFVDEIDVPARYTLRFRVRLDDRPLMDGTTPGGGLGRWVMHCHIFFHAVNGMISELVVLATNGNEAPLVNSTSSTVTVVQGQTAAMTGTYSDRDGDTVALTGPSIGALVNNQNGTWSWSAPTSAGMGPDQILYVTATDAGGRKNQVAFRLLITTRRTPADFDGNGSTDISVFRPSTGQWFVNGQATVSFGVNGDVPVPGDYDGNGSADKAVFRPSVGGWYRNGASTTFFGFNGDTPVPGDYDGNGTTDIAIFRPSVGGWYRNAGPTTFFGLNGDIPVPGDYDGNGTTDIAIFRPSVGGWYRNGASTTFFGLNGDIPVPGDYDGNGTTDIAIFRPSVGGWYRNGGPTTFLGLSGDIPVPGDYDGNGTTDIAVFRPSTGQWFVHGQAGAFLGVSSDLPLPLPAAIRAAAFP
jgi:FtsP/CotA-like multicopper oxidase with cupredoxin domain